MIAFPDAEKQADRLLTLRLLFHDQPNELRQEYMRALMSHAHDKFHAERTVDAIMDLETERVSVATLIGKLGETPAGNAGPYPNQCGQCGGTGFIQTTVTATLGVYAGFVYPAVRRCKCHQSILAPTEKSVEAWRQRKTQWRDFS